MNFSKSTLNFVEKNKFKLEHDSSGKRERIKKSLYWESAHEVLNIFLKENKIREKIFVAYDVDMPQWPKLATYKYTKNEEEMLNYLEKFFSTQTLFKELTLHVTEQDRITCTHIKDYTYEKLSPQEFIEKIKMHLNTDNFVFISSRNRKIKKVDDIKSSIIFAIGILKNSTDFYGDPINQYVCRFGNGYYHPSWLFGKYIC